MRVALEHAPDGQGVVDEFLRSDGGRPACTRLLALPAWSTNDGRGSAAMFDLLDGCRRLRAGGHPLDVRLVDAGWGDVHARRNDIMSERLADACSSGYAVVALLGNVHARLNGRLPDGRPLVSLLGVHGGGTAWCMRSRLGRVVSGPHPFRGSELGDEPFIQLTTSQPGYDGVAYVGPITPSPPARLPVP